MLQRYMAWEHSMPGDLDPAQVQAAADGDAGPVAGYRDLLAELGRAPRQADEERLRAAHRWLDPVRLRGSGLVVTRGELNVLPDYLGRPEDIESAPRSFIGPLIIFDRFPDHVEQGGRLVPLPQWHRAGLRDLCFGLFGGGHGGGGHGGGHH